MSKKPKVVLCLSGGFDSSIVAALKRDTHDLLPLFFDYGQAPVNEELTAARAVCEMLKLSPPTILALPSIASGPSWESSPYFPYRNLVFLSQAAAYADRVGAEAVWFGFVADTDPVQFPDATETFCIEGNHLLDSIYGRKSAIRVEAPCIDSYKCDLLLAVLHHGLDLRRTYSCYNAKVRCATCASCKAVINAFELAGKKSGVDLDMLDQLNPYVSVTTCF